MATTFDWVWMELELVMGLFGFGNMMVILPLRMLYCLHCWMMYNTTWEQTLCL